MHDIPVFSPPEAESLFLASRRGLRTYQDLDRFKACFLRLLMDMETDLDRPIGFLAHSSDELILAIASCWKLGIPFICYNPDAPAHELQRQMAQVEPGLVFTGNGIDKDPGTVPTVSLQKLDVESVFSGRPVADEMVIHFKPDTDPEQIFGYFFTSGTTGISKAVPLKRRQMLFAADASARNFRPKVNHFWLLCLPLYHIGGISIILRSILYGTGIYRMKNFDQEMVSTFLSENALFQAASLVPTMLKRLMNIQAFQTHKNFKAILLGGGPVSPQLLEESRKKGIPVVASYGMTETCAQIAANCLLEPSGIYTPLRSTGMLFAPNKIEIRDDSGRKLGPNNSGSIWLRGPQVFDGYLDREMNSTAFDENGWYNTGDFGHMNANKQLFIESRRTDLIITGGENVSPYEIESELEKISPINEAAVLGIPDEEWGQQVVAVVSTHARENIRMEEIRDQLKEKVTAFKIPKQIIRIDALPKNPTGKIIRGDLEKFFKK